MTPMSPTYCSIECSTHQSAIVPKHTKDTQYCLPVKRSFVGRIVLISRSHSPSGERAGLYDTRRKSQMTRIEMAETGSATANQLPQSRGGSIACSAMRFCGEDMGELCPPIFAASAIASCTTSRSAPHNSVKAEQHLQ